MNRLICKKMCSEIYLVTDMSTSFAAKDGAGALDEDDFIRAFEDVSPVHVRSNVTTLRISQLILCCVENIKQITKERKVNTQMDK
uniref:Uncharacterized protein n=1 Tax=Eptatretus burgeri TaxID=7764 RepID=A0A8C4R144_EPTBU